jgi:hypothetical protein
MADTSREPLPSRRIGRQRGHRIDAAPDQPDHHQQQHDIADIGVDRAMEKPVRPRRKVVHPPAIGEHADDDKAEAPMKQPGNAPPALAGISDHERTRLSRLSDSFYPSFRGDANGPRKARPVDIEPGISRFRVWSLRTIPE